MAMFDRCVVSVFHFDFQNWCMSYALLVPQPVAQRRCECPMTAHLSRTTLALSAKSRSQPCHTIRSLNNPLCLIGCGEVLIKYFRFRGFREWLMNSSTTLSESEKKVLGFRCHCRFWIASQFEQFPCVHSCRQSPVSHTWVCWARVL